MSDEQRRLALELADRCRDRANSPTRDELELLADLIDEIFDPPDPPSRKSLLDLRRYWVAREFFYWRIEMGLPRKKAYSKLCERWKVSESYIDKARAKHKKMKDWELSNRDAERLRQFRTKFLSDR